MRILIFGLSFFIIAFILHFTIWKIRVPRRQINALLMFFFGTLALSILLSSLFVGIGLLEYLQIILLFTSLTAAYIITYSAIEVDSPSLSLMLAFSAAGRAGLVMEDIYKFMTDEKLVIPRINDLVRDKLITDDYGKYRLTRSGKNFVLIFILYRNFLGLGKGG